MALSSEDLLGLGLKCASAAGTYGAGIGLSARRSADALKALRGAADKAEKDFQKGVSSLMPLRKAFGLAREDARLRLTSCRDVLKRKCGAQYGQAWNEAGWKGSLALPRLLNGMLSTLGSLEKFFADHPDDEVDKPGVTGVQCKAAFDALDGARRAVSDQEVTNKQLHDARDTAFEAFPASVR